MNVTIQTSHFHAQRDRSLADLARRKLARSSTEPVLFRLLWKLGVAVPPPHFMAFAPLWMLCASWFTLGWGCLMWFTVWSNEGQSPSTAALVALGAGICWGLTMALYYRHQRNKFGLPSWESFGK